MKGKQIGEHEGIINYTIGQRKGIKIANNNPLYVINIDADNNSIIVGLEYQLAPGWKTYWKSPGGGGFPQNINWDNSENISELDIYWPPQNILKF